MNDSRLFTFCVTAYNSELYLSRMLDSLLQQTCSNFNVIVCDDGSTDHTYDTLKMYQQAFFAKKIGYTVFTKPNGGVSSAINSILPLIKTKYFLSADSDDWYELNVVDSLYGFYATNKNFPFAVFGCINHSGGSDYTWNTRYDLNPPRDWMDTYVLGTGVACYTGIHVFETRSFFKSVGESIIPSRAGQNYQMLLPMLAHYTPSIIPGLFYHYYHRPNSLCRAQLDYLSSKRGAKELNELLMKVLSELSLLEKYRAPLRALFADKMCNLAFRYANRKDFLAFYPDSSKTRRLKAKRIFILFPFSSILIRKKYEKRER